jgi:tRNA 2-thiouridine synthesizing protein E
MASLQRQYVRSEVPQHLPLQFDDQGFVTDPCSWTAEASRVIAEMDDVGPLGPDHWRVIYRLRFHYLLGCAHLRAQRLAENCEERDVARRLFGSCREAWRVAGLPDPGEAVRGHLG